MTATYDSSNDALDADERLLADALSDGRGPRRTDTAFAASVRADVAKARGLGRLTRAHQLLGALSTTAAVACALFFVSLESPTPSVAPADTRTLDLAAVTDASLEALFDESDAVPDDDDALVALAESWSAFAYADADEGDAADTNDDTPSLASAFFGDADDDTLLALNDALDARLVQ